jgi:glucosamine kinase
MNAFGRADLLLLGIDGGGSSCRARLCTLSGAKLGKGTGGPANIRLGLDQSFASIFQATTQCMSQAGLSPSDFGRIVACLALAGASEPKELDAARGRKLPFGKAIFATDARAACVGAHGGRNGGIIVVGTGSIGWGELDGQVYRIGGWGWPISDEGSGAWLGCEALRRALWAHDGRIAWTALLSSLSEKFRSDPHAVVRWMGGAMPRDFATLAPAIVEHASANDPVAVELMRLAGGHIDALARRLIACGVDRLCLTGSLAAAIEPWLDEATQQHLVAPLGDPVDGALQLARDAAGSNTDSIVSNRPWAPSA